MEPTPHVVVVDDNQGIREAISEALVIKGYRIDTAASGEEACELVVQQEIDVVLLDVKMPGMGGLETLKHLKKLSPLTEVIILTGYGVVEDVVEAMRYGAYHYLCKPCDLDELESVILEAHKSRQEKILKQELTRREIFPELIGKSHQLKAIKVLLEKVAPTNSTVLIQGESGVGKELIARCVHRFSLRKTQPLVVVDCTSLQDTLLQSELFGHEKGAFTGAITRKLGLFEVANHGTIFSDEIGEISLPVQVQLLRVLEVGTFRRVGDTQDRTVNVRIIAATNQDLHRLVEQGAFRKDLYFRLNVITIHVPPLRERKEDILSLVERFLGHTGIPGKRKTRIAPEALEVLLSYPWPGNVRELRNVLERAVILAEGEEIEVKDLPCRAPKREATLLRTTFILPSFRRDRETLHCHAPQRIFWSPCEDSQHSPD